MLETDSGFTLMGADTPPGMEYNARQQHRASASAATTPTSCAATGRSCPTAAPCRVPLEKQMWGDEFGMCMDRFGIAWMVNIGQPQA